MIQRRVIFFQNPHQPYFAIRIARHRKPHCIRSRAFGEMRAQASRIPEIA
jgi:hypothetical protein